MQETRVQSLGQEKEMATHSNTLAWEIPWTEKPGGPWVCKRVRHDLATEQQQLNTHFQKKKDTIASEIVHGLCSPESHFISPIPVTCGKGSQEDSLSERHLRKHLLSHEAHHIPLLSRARQL